MYFLVDSVNKIVFGWSAKCGCSHIKRIGYYLMRGSETEQIHTERDFQPLPENIQEYNTILIIRNPYKRIVSGVLDKYSTRGEYRHMWEDKQMTFRLFVNALKNENWKMIDRHHFAPQTTERFDEIAITKSKTLKLYDIENIDYSYIESVYSKSIPTSLIQRKFGHERGKFDSDFDGAVYDVEIENYECKNVQTRQFFNDEIKTIVDEIYRGDLLFFKKHGFDYNCEIMHSSIHVHNAVSSDLSAFSASGARVVELTPSHTRILLRNKFGRLYGTLHSLR